MAESTIRLAFIACALVATGIGAGTAKADGLPVLGIDVGPVGVVAPPGDARYVTLPAGRDTVVARIRPAGGRVLASRLLRGTFTIPAVAYDGSASGLTADGRTLVLIQPRASFPRSRTALAVVDTRALRLRRTIRLRGDFSFDAVSPRGSLMYLIQYTSPRDPLRYLVRAYDLRAGRLLAEPVTDPRERGEKMRGSPLSRATSPDGRWAYTLYIRPGDSPFVHALDTSARTARCVDLDAIPASYVADFRLLVSRDGGTLAVRDGTETALVVDTRTFRATKPAEPTAGQQSGLPWSLAGGAGLGLLAAGALLLAIRRRRRLKATGVAGV